ncbi:hypothetical protein Sros01_04640 [Streptomyces roseochromogenus]|nr:hypothetical protein Sros01_04640 [Streptomyces roseochromogenus]
MPSGSCIAAIDHEIDEYSPPIAMARQMFWNWIGRSHDDIAQAREDWMNGTRFGEVKGYDGPPIPSQELPPTHLKPRGRMR